MENTAIDSNISTDNTIRGVIENNKYWVTTEMEIKNTNLTEMKLFKKNENHPFNFKSSISFLLIDS
jgi:hypothetical protein